MKTRYFLLSNGNKVDLKNVSELAKVASLLKERSNFYALDNFFQLSNEVKKIIVLLGSELSTSMKVNNRILIFHDDLFMEFDNNLLTCYQLLINDSLGLQLLSKAIHFKLSTDFIINYSTTDKTVFEECAKIGEEYNDLVNDHLFIEKSIIEIDDNNPKSRK